MSTRAASLCYRCFCTTMVQTEGMPGVVLFTRLHVSKWTECKSAVTNGARVCDSVLKNTLIFVCSWSFSLK
jgi:hypothetical protein